MKRNSTFDRVCYWLAYNNQTQYCRNDKEIQEHKKVAKAYLSDLCAQCFKLWQAMPDGNPLKGFYYQLYKLVLIHTYQ